MIALALAAAAQVEPSPAALALTHAMSDAPLSAQELASARGGIARDLLSTQAAWRGLPCDAAVPACRAAAERLADEVAPTVLAERRAYRDRLLAIVIDDRMVPADIAAAATFVQTPAGRSMVDAMTALQSPGALSPALRERLGAAMMATSPGTAQRGLIDRFYDATAGLPRRKPMLVPPPPQPSKPPASQP